jgi:hypothetical protein
MKRGIGRYRRLQDLYHKPGIIDDSITGMEWMEEGYGL